MKTLQKVTKNNQVKVNAFTLIAFLFFCLINVNTGFSTIQVPIPVVENNILYLELEEGDMSDAEVAYYLNNYGYEVFHIEYYKRGSFDRIVTTQNDYQTIVYVKDGGGVGYEDVQI
ncbi:MAG: hypothetical protein M3Q58_02720 [Bacteroidota bacterium]|nr:hypothetical protein [Bacteroidota bacterium]